MFGLSFGGSWKKKTCKLTLFFSGAAKVETICKSLAPYSQKVHDLVSTHGVKPTKHLMTYNSCVTFASLPYSSNFPLTCYR